MHVGHAWLVKLVAGLSELWVLQILHPITKQSHRIWFENPVVGKPLKDVGGGRHERLFPRDCREGVSLCMPTVDLSAIVVLASLCWTGCHLLNKLVHRFMQSADSGRLSVADSGLLCMLRRVRHTTLPCI